MGSHWFLLHTVLRGGLISVEIKPHIHITGSCEVVKALSGRTSVLADG